MSNSNKNITKNDKFAKILGGMKKGVSGNRPPLNLCRLTSQDTVPIYAVHEKENIIETYPNFYTRTYQISENNYQTDTEDIQYQTFAGLRSVFNSIGINCELSFSVFNRNINLDEFKDLALRKETGDELDYLRRELNDIILSRIQEGKNGLVKTKYVTVGIHTDSLKKAYEVFNGRLQNELKSAFVKLKSNLTMLSIEQRLEIVHDMYNINNQGEFLTKTRVSNFETGETSEVSSFDLTDVRSMGLSVADVVAPSSVRVFPKYMQFGKTYVCAMRITNYPSSLSDTFFVKLTDVGFNIISTMSINPIPTSEANSIVNKNIKLARNEKIEERQNLLKNNLPEDMISLDVQEKLEKAEEMRTDMLENDEKLFKTVHTIVFWADTKEKLREYTDTIRSLCQAEVVSIQIMEDMQEEGFNTTLPLLYNCIPYKMKRTLKSSSLTCAAMPFANVELSDPGGINYSVNIASKNLILYNRLNANNYNGFILGTPGCVDADTEYFNGAEWKRIADYTEGEQVLQFNTVNNEASLVVPQRYIKKPCEKMYHFETAWGIDQVLSPEHRVLYRTYLHRSKKYSEIKEILAEDLYNHIKERPFHGRIQTNFDFSGPGIDLTDEEIKIMLAVIADGCFDYRYPNSNYCSIHLKKERKIKELRKILTEWGEPFKESKVQDGYTNFYFKAPRREKEFLPYWYNCNAHQLRVVCDNVLNWDGNVTRGKSFASSSKTSADFVQFAFSTCGYRATISYTDRIGEIRVANDKEYVRNSGTYTVNISSHTMTGFDSIDDNGENRLVCEEVVPSDGFKYCFTVPTSALILRRNGRIFVTGNSGKSFTAKIEMLNVVLGSNAQCIIIDPESEYGALAKLIGGEVIKIVPGGKWHINPLEITENYEFDDETTTDPVLAKADFILRLFEVIIKSPFGLNSIQEVIIDECLHELYAPFMKNGKLQAIPKDKMPTLTDLQVKLAQRQEPEARELAIALKMYTGNGSLNVFGFQSNVDISNRFIVYDIKDVGDKLKPLAMLIILDSIQNALFENRKRGKNTWFWVDECHLLFLDESTASTLATIWKRARKYGGVPTGITQNVEDLLKSPTCKTLLSNCNFIQILNQAALDRENLRELLGLSDAQVDIITEAPKGQGLIYTGTNCVGFYSVFPKNNSIYRCLTSNMKEIKEYEEAERRAKAKQTET